MMLAVVENMECKYDKWLEIKLEDNIRAFLLHHNSS